MDKRAVYYSKSGESYYLRGHYANHNRSASLTVNPLKFSPRQGDSVYINERYYHVANVEVDKKLAGTKLVLSEPSDPSGGKRHK